MEEETDKLSNVLRQWEGMEPEPGFRERVWKRINSDSAVEETASKTGTGSDGTFESEWFLPLAAAAMLVLAVGIGLLTSGNRGAADGAMAHPGTLTGAYVQMAAGGQR
jgi:hypothetical protein